uniref:Unclassified n=1 Tax=Fusarium clavum TaxID=2594811 RepID=W1IBY5_9HYPO|nr:unclassified [Fusarium clavum]CEF82636.1 unclassified [Fusarium clavum]
MMRRTAMKGPTVGRNFSGQKQLDPERRADRYVWYGMVWYGMQCNASRQEKGQGRLDWTELDWTEKEMLFFLYSPGILKALWCAGGMETVALALIRMRYDSRGG